ncbi:ROK family protein [Flexithrix dorotheae]|uniref:ROK family protein n=1 Tax=Flexithrix dorotheae TaxID=70993 RepID=UPI00036A6A46|nr:ROK family protein [Flexithrix dorotheae]
MAVLALDLGGTKIAVAVFSTQGELIFRDTVFLNHGDGQTVGSLITSQVETQIEKYNINSIGISVPGISRQTTGTVYAPNISGWDDYPLLKEVRQVAGDRHISIDSDRACSIFGEQWKGNAQNCNNAIFMAVGTGIGAGIVVNGNLVRGANDIAGAIGWMALNKPYENKYKACGCFEHYASGEGIPRLALEVLQQFSTPSLLRDVLPDQLSAYHVFDAYYKNDQLAIKIIDEFVAYWGMASANMVSIFNPSKIIFGGGIFGPADQFIERIKLEATRWAQPISVTKVDFEKSVLGPDAAVYGAAFLTLKNTNRI